IGTGQPSGSAAAAGEDAPWPRRERSGSRPRDLLLFAAKTLWGNGSSRSGNFQGYSRGGPVRWPTLKVATELRGKEMNAQRPIDPRATGSVAPQPNAGPGPD